MVEKRLENLAGIQRSIDILERLLYTMGTKEGPPKLNFEDETLDDDERLRRSKIVARAGEKIMYVGLERLYMLRRASTLYVGLGKVKDQMMRNILIQPQAPYSDKSINPQ